MADREAAERAVKDANPIIDGRKSNVNLAYLGAKPRNNNPTNNGQYSLTHLLFISHFNLSLSLSILHVLNIPFLQNLLKIYIHCFSM